MTVKAVYEGGVFKPKGPVALADKAEVEIEIHLLDRGDPGDPRAFVGFIANAPEGVPLAANHDDHLD